MQTSSGFARYAAMCTTAALCLRITPALCAALAQTNSKSSIKTNANYVLLKEKIPSSWLLGIFPCVCMIKRKRLSYLPAHR